MWTTCYSVTAFSSTPKIHGSRNQLAHWFPRIKSEGVTLLWAWLRVSHNLASRFWRGLPWSQDLTGTGSFSEADCSHDWHTVISCWWVALVSLWQSPLYRLLKCSRTWQLDYPRACNPGDNQIQTWCFLLFKKIFFCTWECSCVHVYLPRVCLVLSVDKGGCQLPWDWMLVSCLCGCQEPILGLLQEHQLLLTSSQLISPASDTWIVMT